jgi:hypothetical protein
MDLTILDLDVGEEDITTKAFCYRESTKFDVLDFIYIFIAGKGNV